MDRPADPTPFQDAIGDPSHLAGKVAEGWIGQEARDPSSRFGAESAERQTIFVPPPFSGEVEEELAQIRGDAGFSQER
jgi:hypothetical protein